MRGNLTLFKELQSPTFLDRKPHLFQSLIADHHIYLLKTGRVSMASVTTATAVRIADGTCQRVFELNSEVQTRTSQHVIGTFPLIPIEATHA